MTDQQLKSFIEEMEDRAIEFDRQCIILSSSYFQGKATEARFVIDRLKELMK